MTEHNGHQRTTFECVDSEPEVIDGAAADLHGALFYFVKADCDGLGSTEHCPRYNAEKQTNHMCCLL